MIFILHMILVCCWVYKSLHLLMVLLTSCLNQACQSVPASYFGHAFTFHFNACDFFSILTLMLFLYSCLLPYSGFPQLRACSFTHALTPFMLLCNFSCHSFSTPVLALSMVFHPLYDYHSNPVFVESSCHLIICNYPCNYPSH